VLLHKHVLKTGFMKAFIITRNLPFIQWARPLVLMKAGFVVFSLLCETSGGAWTPLRRTEWAEDAYVSAIMGHSRYRILLGSIRVTAGQKTCRRGRCTSSGTRRTWSTASSTACWSPPCTRSWPWSCSTCWGHSSACPYRRRSTWAWTSWCWCSPRASASPLSLLGI